MRLVQASAFALFLLTATSVGSFAADLKSDVTAAYAAWDAAFNKGDAKILATAYLPNARPQTTSPALVPAGAVSLRKHEGRMSGWRGRIRRSGDRLI